jgi:hypothetical protein
MFGRKLSKEQVLDSINPSGCFVSIQEIKEKYNPNHKITVKNLNEDEEKNYLPNDNNERSTNTHTIYKQ